MAPITFTMNRGRLTRRTEEYLTGSKVLGMTGSILRQLSHSRDFCILVVEDNPTPLKPKDAAHGWVSWCAAGMSLCVKSTQKRSFRKTAATMVRKRTRREVKTGTRLARRETDQKHGQLDLCAAQFAARIEVAVTLNPALRKDGGRLQVDPKGRGSSCAIWKATAWNSSV